MDESNFKITIHAKTILLGEHAVTRGYEAIVLPLFTRKLNLSFKLGTVNRLAAISNDHNQKQLLAIFWQAFARALQLTGKSTKSISGCFSINSDIPIGVGMGFSAALCVAISHWFAAMSWIPEQNIFQLSQQLENVFHKKSSGLDIAGVMANDIIAYQINKPSSIILAQWRPKLYLSLPENGSHTYQCISIVEKLWKINPKLAKQIDDEMCQSVQMGKHALNLAESEGLRLLKKSFFKAHHCFQAWNLVPNVMQEHINTLLQAGALAAKPTGSGNGGYVLSLWKQSPNIDLCSFELLPVMCNMHNDI